MTLAKEEYERSAGRWEIINDGGIVLEASS
jgi:hypothetical protein